VPYASRLVTQPPKWKTHWQIECGGHELVRPSAGTHRRRIARGGRGPPELHSARGHDPNTAQQGCLRCRRGAARRGGRLSEQRPNKRLIPPKVPTGHKPCRRDELGHRPLRTLNPACKAPPRRAGLAKARGAHYSHAMGTFPPFW